MPFTRDIDLSIFINPNTFDEDRQEYFEIISDNRVRVGTTLPIEFLEDDSYESSSEFSEFSLSSSSSTRCVKKNKTIKAEIKTLSTKKYIESPLTQEIIKEIIDFCWGKDLSKVEIMINGIRVFTDNTTNLQLLKRLIYKTIENKSEFIEKGEFEV